MALDALRQAAKAAHHTADGGAAAEPESAGRGLAATMSRERGLHGATCNCYSVCHCFNVRLDPPKHEQNSSRFVTICDGQVGLYSCVNVMALRLANWSRDVNPMASLWTDQSGSGMQSADPVICPMQTPETMPGFAVTSPEESHCSAVTAVACCGDYVCSAGGDGRHPCAQSHHPRVCQVRSAT